MDYGGLINRAFNLAWKHKTFWILGFLAASWGYLGGLEDKFPNLSDNFNWGHDFDFEPHLIENISDWMTSGPGIALAIAMVGFFLFLGLVMFVLHLISVAGLIEGVVRVENGDSHNLKELFFAGVRQFWPFLGLFFLTFFAGGVYYALLVIPLIVAIIALKAFGLLFLIIFIPMAIAGMFLLSNLYSLAQREIVINGTSVFKAVGEVFQLLKNNLGPNIIIFFITTFLWIGIIICGLVLAIIFAIPAFIIGAWSTLFMIIALVVILPVLLSVAIVVEGFLGTFFNSLFTYFYLELRKKASSEENKTNPDILPAN